MQEFIIKKNEAGQRFDKFLIKYFKGAQKSFIYKMLRKKNIILNGNKADGSEILSIGDSVKSFFSDETFIKFTANANPPKDRDNHQINNEKIFNSIEIVYEDEDILIVNKPAGVLSQKAQPSDYSVNDFLIDYLISKNEIDLEQLNTFKPSICNRLDRNTSGLLLCGKTLPGVQFLTKIIREGSLEKHYQTICHGIISSHLKINGYLIKNKSENISRICKEEGSESILTEFTPLAIKSNATLLDVNLHTGKPHQIRVQLLALGHPIYGDKKYFDVKQLNNIDKALKYQLLHCYKVKFPNIEYLPDTFLHLSNKEIIIPNSKIIENTLSKL